MHWIINFENGRSPCRVNQAAAAVGQFIYSFGGYCQQTTVGDLKYYSPIDVHVLNTISFKWHKRPKPLIKDQQYLTTPYFRYGHTCVTYNNLIYLWGGRADWTNSLCNTLFEYVPTKHLWKKIETYGNKPDGRDGHSASVIESTGVMYIFGGYVQKLKKFSNDIYEYNFITSEWTLVIPKTSLKPHWRDFHTASSVDHKMYIFGGRMDQGHEIFTGESFYSNDLYVFDTVKRIWTELRPDSSHHVTSSVDSNTIKSKIFSPCGRRSHSAVVFKKKIIIFGGFQENTHKHFNDIYEFDIETNEWKAINCTGISPTPRRRHSCCIINNRMFLFGGTGPSIESTHSNFNSSNQLALIANNAAQNEVFIQNLRIIEPALHQLEINLNHINNALRDRNHLNFNILNQALGVALAALARPRLEAPLRANEQIDLQNFNNENNLDITNNIDQNDPNNYRLPTIRIQNLIIQEPQEEFANETQEYPENERIEINELNANNQNNELDEINNHNNNYIVEEEDEDNIFNENDDDDINFIDSGEEDLIDESTEDEDDQNQGLISLSDLHVLDLEVSTLRYLSIMKILHKNISYEGKLPRNLINEIDSLKS